MRKKPSPKLYAHKLIFLHRSSTQQLDNMLGYNKNEDESDDEIVNCMQLLFWMGSLENDVYFMFPKAPQEHV